MDSLKGDQLREGVPLYLQIRDVLASELARGAWKPGDQLPTEPELRVRFNVSEGTVRQALLALVKEGRVTRRSGKGTFVTKPRFDQSFARFFRFRREIEDPNPNFRLTLIGTKVLPATDQPVVETLKLRRGARVLAIHRSILQNEIVVCHYVSYLSHAEFGVLSGEDMENCALYDVLESRCGVHIVRATETLQAGAASAQDAEILKIKKGDPVITVERIAFTYQNRPVELRRTVGRSDTFRYEIQLS